MSGPAGAVASGHSATSEAGADILRAGGNAVDAAIAAIATSFIAEPVLTAPGGGGFMLIANASGKATLFDGFARMPVAERLTGIEPEMKAVPIDFGDTVQTFHIGQGSVGTPSLLAMLFTAHKQHGRLPLRDVLAPGIDAARSGIRLNALQASFIGLLRPILTSTDSCSALHAPAGDLPTEGENFSNSDLANTLEMLAIEGIDEMYHGDLAREIVKACSPYGLLGMQDMRARQVTERKPLSLQLLGGRLLTNPPPSSGGLLIGFAASILDQLLSFEACRNLPWSLLISESLHTASLLRTAGLDASIHQPGIHERILASDHLQTAAASACQRLGTARPPELSERSNRLGSTTHVSVIDGDGMAVSVTTSNGEGSGIVVPGTGLHLNNMLGEEDINPLGFHALAGGTTLSSMMAPSIFLEDGRPSIVLGSGGSNRLRGAILQVLARLRLRGEDIETAVHAARLHNEGMELDIEPGLISDHEREQLLQRGWHLREWQDQSIYFGGVHAIRRRSDGSFHGAGDPRRGGVVAFA